VSERRGWKWRAKHSDRETKNGRIEEVKDRQFLRGKLQKRERFGDV
jgi:hypothetical protein